ncbi:protein WVD2-like 7 [Hibiscus syriacus]|uniref:protein WVD2-like 7 n=1 Tax=Hibiscus syriacus TaxID=106335 RepID=UPI00192159A7|nr:protein WVD2-like 7 [Hibiscus syriacus]
MAGEFEEPFSFSLLAESVHCGSISFGRFANEPLAWERKSSFSHNRYLEEVEKCSKPGSVIEKKAYFEAHFRKKALLQSSSSEGQNGGEYQNCESDAMENDDYGEYQTGENDADSVSKGSHYNHLDENGLSSTGYGEIFYCGNEGSLFHHENEGNHFDHSNESSLCAQFDMSPDNSEYLGEGALTESEIGSPGLLSAHQTHVSVPIDFEPEETSESHSGCAKSFISNDNQEKEVEENLDDDDDADNIDESFESLDQSLNTGTTREVDTTISEIQQNHSPKLKSAIENKATKPSLKSPVSPNHSQKKTFCDPSMEVVRVQERKEKEITKRTKPQKLPLQTAFPTRRSMHKSPKQEDSARARFNAKSNVENKSGKGPMTKKVIEAQPFSYKKIEPVIHQTPNRIKQAAISTGEDAKSTAGGFHFKSGERAEKRKEFFTKLEEKMHAKESEMNQIQARAQEKTKAEIKQLRKSLNFKAKPMPSFYHVSTTSGSTGNKAATSTMKSAKVGQKSPNSGIRAIPRSPSRSRETNKQALSAAGSVGELICPTGTVSPAPPTDSHSSAEPVTQNKIPSKKEQKKENSNLQKHRMSESNKVVKDHKFGGRPKVGGRRNNSELVTKNMKNAGMAGSSGIGRCAVMPS